MSSLATRDEIMAQAARTPAASQATSIEQSRAVAEVQAAVVIAQNRPRDVSEVTKRVKESCQTKELAEVAFFKIPRGGQTLVGESIHLAIEQSSYSRRSSGVFGTTISAICLCGGSRGCQCCLAKHGFFVRLCRAFL